MNYIDYIRSNKKLIKEPLKIKQYKGISRKDIFSLVDNRDFYKALMLILDWGGAFQSNRNRVLGMKEDVKSKLERTYNLVNGTDEVQCDVEKAFRLMFDKPSNDEQDNRINGIGVSFLTKVLFFFDKSKKGKKALIFDKWSQIEHCALIIANNERLDDFYRIIQTKRSIKITSYQKDIYYLYDDYMTRMRSIATDLGMDNIGKLEEFLFGYSLGSKEDKECQQHDKTQHIVDSSNPRRFLLNYLKDYCNKKTVTNKKETNSKKNNNLQDNEWEAIKHDFRSKNPTTRWSDIIRLK